MIAVHFFASIRESLGCDLEKVDLPAGVSTVEQLITHLVQQHGSDWKNVLEDGQVLVAVNHEITDRQADISSGDEVAFFPPVTGG